MSIQSRLIEYTHNNTLLEGYMAWDDQQPAPQQGVLIAHAWQGRDEFVEAKARQLAEQGYIGFALDMYGKGVRGHDKESNTVLMTGQIIDRSALQARMLAALNVLREQPEVNAAQVAAIGYCFGGLCVLDLARTGEAFSGAISFHGILSAPEHATPPIKAPVLILHGYDDPMAPPEHLQAIQTELTQSGADWQTHAFGGVLHAFTNPEANDMDFGTVYHAQTDKRSWQMTLNFLEEVFS